MPVASEPSIVPAAPPPPPYPASAVAWYATILLAVLYWFSMLDRFIIGLMVDPIKQDLGLTDLQFGVLQGVAFSVTYSLIGLAAGALADRYSRRRLIWFSITIWSLATAAGGLARNFAHLLVARICVGAGEATLNPCASSMITDLFPRARLTTALAVYAMGATVGAGFAYLFGGAMVSAIAGLGPLHLPLLGEVRPWQATFFIVGLPGLVFALLVFAMAEPARRGARAVHEGGASVGRGIVRSYGAMWTFVRTQRRFFAYHYLGFGIAALVVTGAGAWFPAYMGRSFGWRADRIGLYMGITLIASGFVGKLVGGIAVDAMYKRGQRDAQFRWYGAALLGATPLGVLAFTTGSPWLFLAFIGLFLTVTAPFMACASAALNLVTPNELRGTGIALFNAASGSIGTGLGPIVIAALSDRVFAGPGVSSGAALGHGLAATVAIFCPIAAIFLMKGLRAMREAVVAAEAQA
ncbi:MAG: MFS transporter [Solimonas sp.]